MPKASARKKSAVTGMTPEQEKIAEGILDGKDPKQIAAEIDMSPQAVAVTIGRNESIKRAVAAAREELSSITQMTRADVIEGFKDAIELARLSADPGSMIRGYAEIAKMLGFYAPEKKQIEVTDNRGRMISKYEAMSDEELERILSGETIEGDYHRVN